MWESYKNPKNSLQDNKQLTVKFLTCRAVTLVQFYPAQMQKRKKKTKTEIQSAHLTKPKELGLTAPSPGRYLLQYILLPYIYT